MYHLSLIFVLYESSNFRASLSPALSAGGNPWAGKRL